MGEIGRIVEIGGARNVWYWAYGPHETSFALCGPYGSWEEANERGNTAFRGPFEILTYAYRDRAKVAQIIKESRLGQGADLGAALERIRHRM